MWTAKNRRRYDRSALRYPSDLTDEEWAHVDSLIPPARRGGNKRHVDVREVMKICHHAARFSIILICGVTTARSIASITPYMWSAASKVNARPVPPPPSSTAKA